MTTEHRPNRMKRRDKVAQQNDLATTPSPRLDREEQIARIVSPDAFKRRDNRCADPVDLDEIEGALETARAIIALSPEQPDAPSLSNQGGWRAIETAPFDPEWSVLGWEPGMDAAVEMAWRQDMRRWLTRGGGEIRSTHWMPLPAPPGTSREEEQEQFPRPDREEIDRLEKIAREAAPGPWFHCQPHMTLPKTRTIHGPVAAERVDYVSTWDGLGTPPGHRVIVPTARDGTGVRSNDMAHIAAFDPPTVLRLLSTARLAEELAGAGKRVRARCQAMRLDQDATAALDDLCAALQSWEGRNG